MGIKIINGFDLNSPLPLDSRAVVENATEMNELITKNFVSIGQTCFNKADNKLYVLKANNETLEWSEVSPLQIVELELEAIGDGLFVKGTASEIGGKMEWALRNNALISLSATMDGGKAYFSHFSLCYAPIDNDNIAADCGFLCGSTFSGGSPNDIYHVYLKVNEEKDKYQYFCEKVEFKPTTYTPLELTLTQKSSDDYYTYQIILTDEQNQSFITACENNEPIIAIANFVFGGNDINCKVPIALSSSELGMYVGSASFLAIDKVYTCAWGLSNKTLTLNMIGNNFSSEYGLYIDKNENNPNSLMFASTDNTIDISTYQGEEIYFDTINGKPILHTDNTINEYTIPDTKTISIFGNHSILVPKDSTDTNIDLYNHAIEISGTTSGNYDYSIWFNVVSSKNLVVDSLTDLKTLLGNTFKREVFGFSNTSTTPTAIIGIDETQMYNTNGETTSFANLSSITFTDTVTTI